MASKAMSCLLLFMVTSSLLCAAWSSPVRVAEAQKDSSRTKRNASPYEAYESDLINLEPLDYELAYRLSQKRGLDLGLSRGFSGNQAAKHMLGLAAANMPSGPGKRSVRYNN